MTTNRKRQKIVVQRTPDRTITLPDDMSLKQGSQWLHKLHEQDESLVDGHHPISGFHMLDALCAFYDVIERDHGDYAVESATEVSVPTGDRDARDLHWGMITIPTIPSADGWLATSIHWGKHGPELVIGGRYKRKHETLVSAIAEAVRERLRSGGSIYKGKALRITAFDPDDADDVFASAPTFSTPREQETLFLNTEIERALQTSLWNPIEHTDEARVRGFRLRRGILLSGPYGTGKTLTAAHTARRCVENGWTFIHLDDVSGLEHAMRFARRYAPAVVFAEDIDQVMSAERGSKVDAILNEIDGVGSKGHDVITVLTTNHVDRICPAMLRPGRMDALIPMAPPNAGTAERLLLHLGGEDLDPSGIEAVAERLSGAFPAVIAEVVRRARMATLGRPIKMVQAADLADVLDAMDTHRDLMTPKDPDTRSDLEKAAQLVADSLSPPKQSNGSQAVSASAHLS